jgi:hypothetical protein
MRQLAIIVAALALAPSAVAATPSFKLWDLQTDLAHGSRNAFGDVQVKPRAAVVPHGIPVRCAAWCRFGSGWLAFRADPHLRSADVAAASVRYTKRLGWTVQLTLRPAAVARWDAFDRGLRLGAKLRGVPDVLVVAVGDQVAASPLATEIRASKGVVTLTGFSRASAKALENALKR